MDVEIELRDTRRTMGSTTMRIKPGIWLGATASISM
jgi:hypothetical protein